VIAQVTLCKDKRVWA